jgi:hypothetical protein
MPDMVTSLISATFSLQHPRAPIIPASEWLKLWDCTALQQAEFG